MNMKQKKTYTAPAVLEEFKLDSKVRILADSHPVTNVEFEQVEAMGQEVVEKNPVFSHEWTD